MTDNAIQFWTMVSNWIIAAATVWIGVYSIKFVATQNKIIEKQVDVERNGLKLELYDRRFAIYNAIASHVASIPKTYAPSERAGREFWASVAHGEFLLSKTVWEYVCTVNEKTQELLSLYHSFTEINPHGANILKRELKPDCAEKYAPLIAWFENQKGKAADIFRDDLDVSTIHE